MENGSITSALLTKMIEAIYLSGVFPRGPGIPNPFLMCDGHVNCFFLPFLEYIRDEEHNWFTFIGTPYGTNPWQVGDSEQQNGSFNMEIGMGQMKLLQHKITSGYKYQLTKKDVA
jgi:hypothetical protein